MNKIKLTLSSIGALLLPVAALAQIQGTATGGYGSGISSMPQLISAIENAAGLVFGCIAVICFIYAGIKFLTAGGDADKVQEARSAFIWGIAGVVVGLLAFSIIAVVGSILH